jgi:putative transposase
VVGSDWIHLGFVERERTPEPTMKLGIQMHLQESSLSNTLSVLDELGVQRSRKTVHNQTQKTDLQPVSDNNPNHVAVDETAIRINDQQLWLYAAVDPRSNDFLHVRLFPITNSGLTLVFLRELREKHDADNAPFLVDGANHLQAALQQAGLQF